jgi:predicted RNA methylase
MRSIIKRILLGAGRRPRRIWTGLFGGLRLSIDPASETTLLFGLYESETIPFLRRAGRTMKTMIDVGAGYGEMTAWALKHSSTEKVLAFDPKPERWPVFRENMALNGFSDDARLVPVADFFPGNVASEEMLLSLPEPVVMKLDVDGAEMDVLEAIGGVLRRRRFALLVETHSEELDSRCRKFLEDLGYKVTVISQAWWRKWIPEQRPIGFNRWLWAEK